MEIGQLRTFLAVLEHGGFSRAAATLKLTQPTVSFHIKSLEASLGVRLLDRAGGRIRATSAGETLARYAKQIDGLCGEALVKIRLSEDLEAGHLQVAASTIPGEYLLPPILGEFRRRHPMVHIKVRVSDSQEALASLLAEESEIAFVGTRQGDRRLLYAPFADDEIVVIGPRPNPFAPKGSLTPAELARAPLVFREQGSGTRRSLGAFAERNGIGASLEMGSTEAVKRAVRHGMGLGFVGLAAVADDVASGALSLVKVKGLPIRRSFYSVRLKGSTLSAAAKAFLALVHGRRT
jgi:DNA-binding transcriptional LysR family regulator